MKTTEPKQNVQINKDSLNPRELLPKDNNPFLMSKPEFIAVQNYVESGITLPSTEKEMTSILGIKSEDVNKFKDLLDAYTNVHQHCYNFKTVTFPMTVNLAADISHYGTKAPIYYEYINQIINDYISGKMKNEFAVKKLVAIVNLLKNTATQYQENCKSAENHIKDFINETEADQKVINPLFKSYKEKIGSTDGEIDKLLKEIEADRREIEQLENEYNHNVIVAATTPTYAWIFPIGFIPAVVVAGVYGDRATKTLNKIHEYQNKLAKAQGDLRRDHNMLVYTNIATTSISGLIDKLNAALPVLQKMNGIWGALVADLSNILNIIGDISNVEWIIKDISIEEAIFQWKKVADIADNYRVNAYVEQVTEEQIKEDPNKYISKTA